MRTIVSKFGGSSTANAARFKRILDLVRASPARRCVVLSAPGIDAKHPEKVTALLEACWQCRDDLRALDDKIAKVAGRFGEIGDALSVPGAAALAEAEIRAAIRTSLPHTLSRGEYLCARLFSLYSGIPMMDAAKVMRFDRGGALDEARTFQNLRALSERLPRFVLPGFYGADPLGRIVTFPKNGSDITGALAAAGMDAGLYENWTDVPGLMTSDPSVVPAARLIPQVNYCQMRALARAGAQVLHPACLDPVAMAGIPTRLRGTDAPDSFGTLIDEHVVGTAPCLVLARGASLPQKDRRDAERVSVFGIPSAQVLAASGEVGAVDTHIEDGVVKLYLPKGCGEAALKRLHAILIE